MPIMAYACENGHTTKRFFRRAPDAVKTVICGECNKVATRQLRAPNSQSLVVVDNGIQAKAVEVNLDMVEKIREQSTKDFREKE